MLRRRPLHRALETTAILAFAIGMAGCTGAPAPPAAESPRSTPATQGPARVDLPVEPGADVAGLVEVDGHDLYVRCRGSGSPTVLYFHGWITNPADRPADFVTGFERELGGDVRVCSYDRANVGRSAVVGTRQPADLVADAQGVLDALGETEPVIVVGSSFGGAVAEAYIVGHPDNVAGVVFSDADVPDLFALESLWPAGEGACDPALRAADAGESLEKIDNCTLAEWNYDRRSNEPAVPLIYLAAEKNSWGGVSPEYDAQVDDVRRAFAERWTPGEFRWVDSGDVIETDAPAEIANALREVAAAR